MRRALTGFENGNIVITPQIAADGRAQLCCTYDQMADVNGVESARVTYRLDTSTLAQDRGASDWRCWLHLLSQKIRASTV